MSNLIFSGQLSKEEALFELSQPIYPAELFEKDLLFVMKKLGFTQETFARYISEPEVPHANYSMSLSIFDEYPILKSFKYLFNK